MHKHEESVPFQIGEAAGVLHLAVTPYGVSASVSPEGSAYRVAQINKPLGQAGHLLDRTRPEGVYCAWDEKHLFGTQMVIERVNGDCSVSRMVITPSEAAVLAADLHGLLCSFEAKPERGDQHAKDADGA